jgi:hypothetical protein
LWDSITDHGLEDFTQLVTIRSLVPDF